jgi:hypothetical protein
MINKDPALFYFWAHDNVEELKTDTCRDLVKRADIIFLEGVTPVVSISAEIERDFNNYSRDGVLSDKLRGTLEMGHDEQGKFLLDLTKGTPKRYVFEKYPDAPFDFALKEESSGTAFLKYSLEEAMEIREDFLMESMRYNVPREKAATGRIIALDGIVLVIFGAAHPDLQKMIARARPTEIHFPYPDYPVSYTNQEMADFRQTGVLDKELFLRGRMGAIARAAIKSISMSLRERELLAHAYAGIFPLDTMQEYPGYANFCISFSGVSPQDVFESFLKKEKMPLVPEMLEKMRKV